MINFHSFSIIGVGGWHVLLTDHYASDNLLSNDVLFC